MEKTKLNPDHWQQEILDCEDKYILLCKGRQVGGTTTFARKAAETMVKRKGCQIVVASLTEDQAELVVIMTLTHLEQNHKQKIKTPYSKNITKRKIVLKNGSQIISRPIGNTGDAIRGFTGDILYLNESSRMPESVFIASKPILLTTDGAIWMDSTPFGKAGYFYNSWLNKHGRWKVFHITSRECMQDRKISESWTAQQRESALQFLDEEKKDMSELQYAQEYEGLFVEDLQQLFPDDLIKQVMTATRPGQIQRDRDHYLGVDIARMGGDETTFEILKKTRAENLIHVENQITKKTLLTQTADHILGLDRLYDFRRIYVDDEGIGIGVFDMLITDGQTRRKTEALRNSKKLIDYKDDRKTRLQKQDLYMNLLRLMERGEIALLDDDKVRLSLKSVQYEFTTDKKGKPFMRIFGNYTHIVEGLIRAAWCVKDKSLNIFIDYI